MILGGIPGAHFARGDERSQREHSTQTHCCSVTDRRSAAQSVTALSWPAYLYGPAHHSRSPATAITVANASSLHVAWHWNPAPPTGGQPTNALYSSPTVSGGRVFIGSNTGLFSALDETPGNELWTKNLGFSPHLTC